jgi:hypothetical protein
MKKMFFLLSFLFFTSALFAQKEKEKIEEAIVIFFDGLTDVDVPKLKHITTDGFLLLEQGEVWNMDTMVHKLTLYKNPNRKRINKFEFIKTEQKDNIAWVSYFNTAEITVADKKQTIRWLESAVLLKQDKMWKVKLLHSTRMR